MSATAKAAAERIWQVYGRHLGNPGHANQDKESVIFTMTGIIDGAISQAINLTLGEALNSGDGSYKP